jgi:hypothetical protein
MIFDSGSVKLRCALGSRFEQGELVRPRREAAVAAKRLELTQNGDESVVGALLGDVVVVVSSQVGHARAPAVDFEPRGAEE